MSYQPPGRSSLRKPLGGRPGVYRGVPGASTAGPTPLAVADEDTALGFRQAYHSLLNAESASYIEIELGRGTPVPHPSSPLPPDGCVGVVQLVPHRLVDLVSGDRAAGGDDGPVDVHRQVGRAERPLRVVLRVVEP